MYKLGWVEAGGWKVSGEVAIIKMRGDKNIDDGFERNWSEGD